MTIRVRHIWLIRAGQTDLLVYIVVVQRAGNFEQDHGFGNVEVKLLMNTGNSTASRGGAPVENKKRYTYRPV